MEYFILKNGNKLPKICFGPGIMTRKTILSPYKIVRMIQQMRIEKEYCNSIKTCIESGVRFIDYSIAYGREDLVAKAIYESQIERKSFFLTTRVTNRDQERGKTRESVLRSLERLHSDYIDLLMFHWPVTDYFIDTWREIIRLHEEGICKNIGVANCHQHHIRKLVDDTGVMPDVNQIEIHPLFSQKDLVNYCQKQGIQLEAYTPLARMDERMTRLPKIHSLCEKYQKSISQIVLRWHIQNGIIPVFRSLNPNRQKEDLNIFDFELSKEDMSIIDSININSRLRYDPDNCDFSIL
jgi:diketogulonate reductase-like aldo/keto reductase